VRSIYRSDEGQREVRAWCSARLAAWGRAHDTRVVQTELGATHVVSVGTGPPLVLVPGTNFAAATWLSLIGELGETHRVHAVDLPGQPGLSHPGRQKHAGGDFGRWLVAVSEAVDAVQPTVVGHSLGGLVAMHAAAAGASVARLVLLDPAGLRRLSVTPKVLAATLPWLRRSDARSAARLLRMMMAPGGQPDDDLVEWMALVGRHVRSSMAPPALDEAALSRLAGVSIDILSGEHDVFLPPEKLAEAAARRLGDGSFTVIQGAGHLLPHERPGPLVELLRRPSATAPS
jgi:pimeloyl-ACP methyl ester carboxylesterase